jgi:hypothetical protein
MGLIKNVLFKCFVIIKDNQQILLPKKRFDLKSNRQYFDLKSHLKGDTAVSFFRE